MVVRNEPSLQDKRDVESLRLHTRDKNSHGHARSWLTLEFSDKSVLISIFETMRREQTLSRAGDVKI